MQGSSDEHGEYQENLDRSGFGTTLPWLCETRIVRLRGQGNSELKTRLAGEMETYAGGEYEARPALLRRVQAAAQNSPVYRLELDICGWEHDGDERRSIRMRGGRARRGSGLLFLSGSR